ncbi:MAG: hypothetical protein WCR52_00290 [Bacteroidota bacterium]
MSALRYDMTSIGLIFSSEDGNDDPKNKNGNPEMRLNIRSERNRNYSSGNPTFVLCTNRLVAVSRSVATSFYQD